MIRVAALPLGSLAVLSERRDHLLFVPVPWSKTAIDHSVDSLSPWLRGDKLKSRRKLLDVDQSSARRLNVRETVVQPWSRRVAKRSERVHVRTKLLSLLERVKGIEPSYSAWKAAALPLSYTRADADSAFS